MLHRSEENKMPRALGLLLCLTLACTSVLAQSYHDSAISVGVRLSNTAPQKSSIAGVSYELTANHNADLFVIYDLSSNSFIELSLATPTRHRITESYLDDKNVFYSNSDAVITTLPLTISWNYKLWHRNDFDAYAGLGMNIVRMTIKDTAASPWILEQGSHIGLAFQAGVDYSTDYGFKINVNIKKMQQTAILGFADNSGSTTILKMNPSVVGIGLKVNF